mmetsp:Transcript_27468/g.69318  ORF Transcript_27468/g.69318 Transcript_27468/m.69318 type:complete len:314 (-) Transcript_27468:1522-2463(-)
MKSGKLVAQLLILDEHAGSHAGNNIPHCPFKVFPSNYHPTHLPFPIGFSARDWRPPLRLKLVQPADLPNRSPLPCIRTHTVQVRTSEGTGARCGDSCNVNVCRECHFPRERHDDLRLRCLVITPGCLGGAPKATIQELVKPSRSKECWINQVGAVRCPHDKHVCARCRAIHFSKQLAHHSVHHPPRVCPLPPVWGKRIQLVKKHHAGGCLCGPLEHLPHIPLALSDVHVDQLRSFDREERKATLGGHRLGKQRLAGTRGAKQKHPGPSLHARRKQLRVLQRQLNRVQDVLFDLLQTPNVTPLHIWNFESSSDM